MESPCLILISGLKGSPRIPLTRMKPSGSNIFQDPICLFLQKTKVTKIND